MILNQVNMPQLLNLQVVLRDRLHPESLSSFLVGEGWNGVAWLHAGFQE